jgi:hypothetical protein
MKRLLLTTAALALLTTAASAGNETTLYKGKYWEAYAIGANSDGKPMCGMSASNGHVQFLVKWDVDDGMFLSVYKDTWRLPKNANVPVDFYFVDDDGPNSATFSIKNAFVSPIEIPGGSLVANVKDADSDNVLEAFGAAERVIISFPAGNEQPWTVPMEGSRKASIAFKACMAVGQQSASSTTSPITLGKSSGNTSSNDTSF